MTRAPRSGERALRQRGDQNTKAGLPNGFEFSVGAIGPKHSPRLTKLPS